MISSDSPHLPGPLTYVEPNLEQGVEVSLGGQHASEINNGYRILEKATETSLIFLLQC